MTDKSGLPAVEMGMGAHWMGEYEFYYYKALNLTESFADLSNRKRIRHFELRMSTVYIGQIEMFSFQYMHHTMKMYGEMDAKLHSFQPQN
jgi:hypothetical protein